MRGDIGIDNKIGVKFSNQNFMTLDVKLDAIYNRRFDPIFDINLNDNKKIYQSIIYNLTWNDNKIIIDLEYIDKNITHDWSC